MLLVAAVALPLLTLSAYAVWRAYEGERGRMGERLMAQAHAMAMVVDREFDRAEALLSLLADYPALRRGDLAEAEARLRVVSAAQFEGEHLSLTGPDGRQVINTGLPPGTPPALPGSSAAWQVLATGRPVISDLYSSRLNGRPTVAVAVPVMVANGAGPQRHALAATLSLPRLARVLAEQGVPDGGAAAVLDRAGTVVARTHRPEATVGQPAMPAVIQAITAPTRPETLLLETRTLDNVPSIIALGRAARSGYWAALAAPEAAFTGPLHEALLQLLTVGTVLVALGLAFAVALARRLRASLRLLARLGTSDSPRPETAGLREVDDVAEALATAERQRRILVAELNHRVKNVLATVQSIAMQTLRGRAGDAGAFAGALSGRLRALAAAHDLITARSWEAVPVEAVLRTALAPWLEQEGEGVPPIRIEVPVGPVRIAPMQAQTLTLALNELAMNAVRHGALSVAGGQVALHCAMTPAGEVSIRWSERGGPPVTGAPAKQGFGTRLLRRALLHDLGPGARVDLRFEPGGVVAQIGFRAASQAEAS